MHILIVTPAAPGSTMGNRVTAERWAAHLEASQHTVEISEYFSGQSCDLMIALHAVRSASAMERFRKKHPKTPIVLILTGTDLYGALPDDPVALASLQLATILVVLNPLGVNRLPGHLHHRVRTVVQSVTLEHALGSEETSRFQICVVGHLRPVKDPFLAAHALRQLPESSGASLIHVGKALDEDMRLQAETEQRENPRYTWLGERPRLEVLQHLKNSQLHVLTSKMEGGANALCEATALGVPTLATRIDGSVGILGEGYPGLFPVGDASALAQLIDRTELDPEFLDTLREHCLSLQAMVQPAAERSKIDSIIDELCPIATDLSLEDRLPSDDPMPWRAQLDLLLAAADHEGAIRMTQEAIQRLRSNALVKGEPWTWLVRIHANRGNRVELARALLLTGQHTYGEVPGLWAAHLSILPSEHIEAIRRRVEANSRHYYQDMYQGEGVPPMLLRALGVPDQLDTLCTRALQAYGALCLAHFCAAKEVRDPSISELVFHLVKLLVAENVPMWDETLKALDLSGGGDPLPPSLEVLKPESLKSTFHHMVEYVVEIGIGDLFGASTEGPHLDCAILLETMERAGVVPPPIPPVLYEIPAGDWGRPDLSAHRVLHTACQAVLAGGGRR